MFLRSTPCAFQCSSAGADDHIFFNDAGGAHINVGADADTADDKFIALDAGVGEFRFRSKARAGADTHEIGGADIDFADQRILADLDAKRAQIGAHDG